jgi:hypothetical protein
MNVNIDYIHVAIKGIRGGGLDDAFYLCSAVVLGKSCQFLQRHV